MDAIRKAVALLNRGGVVVYPTETVYGLGCNPFSPEAVERVFSIKKRPSGEPLSLAVSSFKMLDEVAFLDEKSRQLAAKLLPGPVTVLLVKKPSVPDYVTAGSKVVGIRFPDHRVALKLIDAFGSAITSTSANISGKPAPGSAGDVKVRADFLIDGGECKYGTASTIVDLANKRILRRGPKADEVQAFLDGV